MLRMKKKRSETYQKHTTLIHPKIDIHAKLIWFQDLITISIQNFIPYGLWIESPRWFSIHFALRNFIKEAFLCESEWMRFRDGKTCSSFFFADNSTRSAQSFLFPFIEKCYLKRFITCTHVNVNLLLFSSGCLKSQEIKNLQVNKNSIKIAQFQKSTRNSTNEIFRDYLLS